MNGFRATATCGPSCSHEEVVVVNGPIALACCAEPWEVEFDGCGMQRITFGQKSIPNSRRDGSTLMLARKLGIILGCTLKVSYFNCAPISYQFLT